MPPSSENLDLAKLFLERLNSGDSPHAAVAALTANADGSDPNVVAQLTDLQNERSRLGTGATAPGQEPAVHPQTAMLQEFHAVRAQGATREDSIAAGFESLFGAAASGDERVASASQDEAKAKWAARQGMRAETHVRYRR